MSDVSNTPSVHFSSEQSSWRTPRQLFDQLNAEFGFTVDVCASDENALLGRYWTEADEALLRSWAGERVWMNPPYGRQISRWIEKAWTEAPDADLIVALVPARTDTAWWHDYAMRADEIRFLRRRLTFGVVTPNGGKSRSIEGNNAPFPSCLLIWRSSIEPGRFPIEFGNDLSLRAESA